MSASTLRPDFILIMEDFRVFILDVKVPYPSQGFVRRTHDRNVAKYQAIADEYEAAGYKKPVILTIIIPSVGCNTRFTHEALIEVGFSRKQSINLLSRMSAMVCRQNELHLRRSLPKVQPLAASAATPEGQDQEDDERVVPPESELEEEQDPEPGEPARGVELDPADFKPSLPETVDELSASFAELFLSPQAVDGTPVHPPPSAPPDPGQVEAAAGD